MDPMVGSSAMAETESDDDLRLATEAAGVGVWRWDLATDSLQLSGQARALIGASESRLEYAEFLDRIHSEDRVKLDRALRESIAADRGLDLDFRTLAPRGPGRWLRICGRVSGSSVGDQQARGILIDIARPQNGGGGQ